MTTKNGDDHAQDDAHGHHRDADHDGHAHAHGHEHGHDHGHAGHSHVPANFGRAFAIGITLNLAYVVAEAGYGLAANSLALLADAGHNLGDVLALFAAWGASRLGRTLPSARYTYGLRRSTILVALGNAVLLLVVTGGIAWEAVLRLLAPEPSAGPIVMMVAAVGIAVNGVTAWLFASGGDDLNIRGAFLHMAADALVSAGVVIAGALIFWTGWTWLDPASSLVVGAVIVWGTWALLRDSVDLALDAVPRGIDLAAVHDCLAALPGVVEVHDLHVWALSTTETAVTAHLVRSEEVGDVGLVPSACVAMRDRFRIAHATFQCETRAMAGVCALRPAEVV